MFATASPLVAQTVRRMPQSSIQGPSTLTSSTPRFECSFGRFPHALKEQNLPQSACRSISFQHGCSSAQLVHIILPKVIEWGSMTKVSVCQAAAKGTVMSLSEGTGPLVSVEDPILVTDGDVVLVDVPRSAADFLRSFPSCPYTTTRTHGGRRRLLFWGAHLERLAQSAQIMQAAGKWEEAEESMAPEQLRRLIRPSLEVALQQANVHSDLATTHELSITVLLLPASDTGSQFGGANFSEEDPPMSAQSVEVSKLGGPNNDGKNERHAIARDRSHSVRDSSLDQQAASLTLQLAEPLETNPLNERAVERRCQSSWSGWERKVKAWVYVSRYEAPEGGGMPRGTTVAIMGPERQLPAAKDSSWALDRRPLEASKPPGVGEVLLTNDGEALLEGLLTNFFVVRRAKGGANRAPSETHAETVVSDTGASASKQHNPSGRLQTPSSVTEGARIAEDAEELDCAATNGRGNEGEHCLENGRWKGLVVQTAALEEGVLPGVVRRAVLRLCEEWGVDVSLEAPRLSDRSTWVEAFVTSSVRIVQPVACVRWRPGWRPTASRTLPGHVAGSDWREHQLPADCPFCRALWDALLDEERLRL